MRTSTPSGRFVLRIDPELHADLRSQANNAGLSLNEYCARTLAGGVGESRLPPGLDTTVRRAKRILGKDLVGVVAFGSWTRGEATDASDLDVLLVLEAGTPLRRALYREWDAESMESDGHAVEVSLTTIPDPEELVAGLWAEVALDGVVLFEREWRVSARLIRTRHDIVAGRIARRVAHGQPYWLVEAGEEMYS